MSRTRPALLVSLALTGLLAGCVAPGPQGAGRGGPGPAATGGNPPAPAVPVDERSHGTFEQLTGINGDAVAAISGDATRSYIYFDAFAANKAALAAAPARLCASYGRTAAASYITAPADRVRGVRTLVVDCTR